jgi:Cdc6-like AAA superfamily ATPase
LGEIGGLLRRDETRLLTLAGPAGVGKTRLAVEVGRRLSGEFAQGVAFVDLAPIRDPSRVTPALAAGVGLQDVESACLPDRLLLPGARLLGLCRRERVCLMCSEAVWWRCHRRMIADALVVRGFPVEHILGETNRQAHELTPWAEVIVEGGGDKRLVYPPGEPARSKHGGRA